MKAPITDVGIAAYADGAYQSRPDRVVTEEPLEIRLGGEPLAVVMRTPGNDLELAAGFLLAEQIIEGPDDLGTIRHCHTGDDATEGNVVDVRLTPARATTAEAILAKRKAERSTVTAASCGVCGKKTIESLAASCPAFLKSPKLDPLNILTLPERLRATQRVFEATGGLHGAGIYDAGAELLVAREDVGRHNAVDKCVGALLLTERLPIPNAILVVSGRTSFEIIQKALVARIQTVVAVSAPSSLAIELAVSSKMGLVGFTRNQSLNVYAGELV